MNGNCIDKFIIKKLDKSIIKILQLRRSIKNRINERNIIDYFNTGCYEKDFNEIIKIRDEAKLLEENCNKFLERISEQYSKLN